MKTKTLKNAIGALLVVASLAGCNNKNGNTTKTEAPATPEATEPTMHSPESNTMSAAASQSAELATNTAAAMTEAVSAAKAKVDGLISQAKSFIADKKYDDAVAALNKLSEMTLTPEQQKTVDDLKAQLKKLIASGSDAANAAKNLLGK